MISTPSTPLMKSKEINKKLEQIMHKLSVIW